MKLTYIIIDDDQKSVQKTQELAERFRNLTFIASANNYEDGVNLILEHQPKLVFLEIDPSDKKSNLSLYLINELYRYLRTVPKIIVVTKGKDLTYEALQYEVIDYLIKPLQLNDFRKAVLKLDKVLYDELQFKAPKYALETFEVLDETLTREEEKLEIHKEYIEVNNEEIVIENELEEEFTEEENDVSIKRKEYSNKPNPQKEEPLIICIKSYGDYRYINSNDVLYLEADNNSTDLHLSDGEMVTAFKTLKHFETVLPQSQFLRIHNSYIININHVSRIHTGNTVCYIKNSSTKLPFSKSYKENVDLIIERIAGGNYLEI